MKTLIIFSVVLFNTQLMAMPKAFEIGYVNHAWGYDAYGCVVDFNRYIYHYKFGHSSTNTPIEKVGQVSETEFKTAQTLAASAAKGTYTEKRVMADAGTVTWTASLPYGREISLKAKGDFYGTNSSPDAKGLVELMDEWCKLPPFPFPE